MWKQLTEEEVKLVHKFLRDITASEIAARRAHRRVAAGSAAAARASLMRLVARTEETWPTIHVTLTSTTHLLVFWQTASPAEDRHAGDTGRPAGTLLAAAEPLSGDTRILLNREVVRSEDGEAIQLVRAALARLAGYSQTPGHETWSALRVGETQQLALVRHGKLVVSVDGKHVRHVPPVVLWFDASEG